MNNNTLNFNKSNTFIRILENSFVEKKINSVKSEFIFEPLNTGLGHTIGNSLRRTILSRIEAGAITSFVISHAQHEFDSIKGILEDMQEIIENLSKLTFNPIDILPSGNEIDICIDGNQVKEFYSSYIANFSHISPLQDIKIFTLNENVIINLKLFLNRGFRFVSDLSLKQKKENDILPNEIFIDTHFTLVEKVVYDLYPSTVLGLENLEKLIITIISKSEKISCLDILLNAIETLYQDFNNLKDLIISKPTNTLENQNKAYEDSKLNFLFNETDVETIGNSIEIEDVFINKQISSIEEISSRCKNALISNKIHTIKDLLKISKKDLSEIKNLGHKSLKIILDLLTENNFTLQD